jgi:hypothetical protein
MSSHFSITGKRTPGELDLQPTSKRRKTEFEYSWLELAFGQCPDILRYTARSLTTREICRLQTTCSSLYQIIKSYLDSKEWPEDHLHLYQFPSCDFKKQKKLNFQIQKGDFSNKYIKFEEGTCGSKLRDHCIYTLKPLSLQKPEDNHSHFAIRKIVYLDLKSSQTFTLETPCYDVMHHSGHLLAITRGGLRRRNEILNIWKSKEDGQHTSLIMKNALCCLKSQKTHQDEPSYLVVIEKEGHLEFFNESEEASYTFDYPPSAQVWHITTYNSLQIITSPTHIVLSEFPAPNDTVTGPVDVQGNASQWIFRKKDKTFFPVKWLPTEKTQHSKMMEYFFLDNIIGRTYWYQIGSKNYLILETKDSEQEMATVEKKFVFDDTDAWWNGQFVQQGSIGVWVGVSHENIKMVFINLESLEPFKLVKISNLLPNSKGSSEDVEMVIPAHFELEFEPYRLIIRDHLLLGFRGAKCYHSMVVNLLDFSVSVLEGLYYKEKLLRRTDKDSIQIFDFQESKESVQSQQN